MATLIKLCRNCVQWTDEDIGKCPVCGNKLIKEKISNVYWSKISDKEKEGYTKGYLNNNEYIAHQQTSSINIPKVRPFWNAEYTLALIFGAFAVLCFILSDLLMIIIGLFSLFITFGFIVTGKEKLKARQIIYDNYKNAPEQYKAELQNLISHEQEVSDIMDKIIEEGGIIIL